MNRKSLVCAAAVAALCAAMLPAQAVPLVALKVVNGASVDRIQEPVSVGVPVAAAMNLYQPYGIRVLDPLGNVIPAQFKVLTRWGGVRTDATKPIRWLSATFRADVGPNATVDYQLALAPGTYAPGELWATQDMNQIVVHTSPTTTFTLDRLSFSLFREVVVDGATIVAAPGGGMDFVNADGSEPVPFVTSTDLEEYQGYLSTRCVVKQKGFVGPLAFTMRYTFVSGRSDVTVDFRLENPAAYGLFSTTIPDGQKYFDRLYLELPISGSGHTATSASGARSLANGALYKLEQTYGTPAPLDSWAGFSFTESLAGATVATGGRSDGGLDVSAADRGVTVVVDRFWQNFPKSLHAQNGTLRVGLWPEYGTGPAYQGQYAVPWNPTPPPDPQSLTAYRFEGGRWKNHRMVFDFHYSAPRTVTQLAESVERGTKPLAGLTPGPYIRNTGAMHTLWTERKDWSNALFDRYERFYDIMVDDNAADNLSSIGKVGYPQFVRRGGTNGGWQHYGWQNYGDLGWVDGYCSLHYDLTESVLSGFLRTGDYRFFDTGRDMAAYRREYGQNHATNASESWRGAQFYEKGWWHGSYTLGQYSHNWVAGMLLHYILTGDEASREAAVENLAFVLRDPPKNWTGYWGSRIPGWQINCLMDGYAYLGDPVYLTEAGLGVERYKVLEVGQGSHGYVLNPGGTPLTTKPWMDNIFFIASAKYVLQSLDFSSTDMLDRMRTYFKTIALTPPSGPPTAMVPTQVYYEWGPTFNGVKSIHLLWPMCEALAWSAVIFNDLDDHAYSQLCFETAVRYWQTGPTSNPLNFYDANTWSKVTHKPGYWPGTESKALANILRWAPAHLTVQMVLDGLW